MRTAMHRFFAALAATFLFAVGVRADPPPPAGNAYDVLAEVIRPIAGVLLPDAAGPERAGFFQIRIDGAGGELPAEIAGTEVKIWVQSTDKLRIEAPVAGRKVTVARDGESVWAAPGEAVGELLRQARGAGAQTTVAQPLSLPFTAQQAMFLPALFDVENREVAEVGELGGKEYRVLRLSPQADLAEPLGLRDSRLVLWVDGKSRIRRIEAQWPGASIAATVERTNFAPSLPAAVWKPPPGEKDIFRTDASGFSSLLEIFLGGKAKPLDKTREQAN